MNCSTCSSALWLHDAFGNKCISCVYCALRDTLVDVHDVCDDYDDFRCEYEVE